MRCIQRGCGLFGWLDFISEKIDSFNACVEQYKNDTGIQSLPNLARINKAKKLIDAGDIQQAKQILTSVTEISGNEGLAYKYLGLAYEKEKDFESAAVNFQKSADINPIDKNIWQSLGFTYINIRKFEQAIASFEKADRISPMNTDIHTGWGMALLKLKRYDEAHKKFCQAVDFNKYNFAALFLTAVTEVELKRYDDAAARLKFLCKVSPNASNTFEYAKLMFFKNDYNTALEFAQKSMSLNSNIEDTYILLAKIYFAKSQKEKALETFELSLSNGIYSCAINLEWAYILEKMTLFDKAAEKLKNVLAVEPDFVDAKKHLALCSAVLKDVNSARDIINDIPCENEDIINTLTEGIIKFSNGDYENAVNILKNKDFGEFEFLAEYYLAKCYENTGNQIKARDYYDSCTMSNIYFAEAYRDYANYLISKGQYDEAKRKLRKALKNNDNNQSLLNLLFYVSYILVKENLCEYNVRETLEITDKIKPELFEYPEQKTELLNILNDGVKRD